MITDDKIATATIAQIFGSELLHLQSKATTDAGSVPQMVKMDPKQFLFDDRAKQQMSYQQRAQEQQMLQSLQREAESAYPMESSYMPPVEPPQLPQQLAPQPVAVQPSGTSGSDVWERIAVSLERIATRLEHTKVVMTKGKVSKPKKIT
jgi:hypothetical protein